MIVLKKRFTMLLGITSTPFPWGHDCSLGPEKPTSPRKGPSSSEKHVL